MTIGFLSSPRDARCPVSAFSINKYVKAGFTVLVEDGLGSELNLNFSDYLKTRQEICQSADIICAVEPPVDIYDKVKADTIIISFYQPYTPGYDGSSYAGKQIRLFSLDMIPRSTLAQSMDALSAMASLAGYKAVLVGATKLPRLFPMMMTASGMIRPANVLVIGAGVAGLQAIATAKRLGARVEAFDVRSVVREQVQSLGAKFVEVEGAKEDKDAGGYAVEQTDDFKQKQKEAIARSVAKSDVVVTTAQIRGRVAPILVTTTMIESMASGSVIIDLASSTGGNCEIVEDQQEIQHQGVTIIGNSALYLYALQDASDLLANIYFNFTELMVNDGSVSIDAENPILSSSQIHPGN